VLGSDEGAGANDAVLPDAEPGSDLGPRGSSSDDDPEAESDPESDPETDAESEVEVEASPSGPDPDTTEEPSAPPKPQVIEFPHCDNPFDPKPSEAAQEWKQRKAEHNEENSVIDELMGYVGLESVKRQFLDIKSNVDICKQQGRALNKERFNIVFQGNPGTGKSRSHSCSDILQTRHVLTWK
jgi:hypothetical protein